jgi:hypothetical protein
MVQSWLFGMVKKKKNNGACKQMTNPTVKKFTEAKQEKLKAILGNEILPYEFVGFINASKGKKYLIHNGWSATNVSVLKEKSETRIAGGIITEAIDRKEMIYVVLDEDRFGVEKFTKASIEKITKKADDYYVIYKDNSYFRITIQ